MFSVKITQISHIWWYVFDRTNLQIELCGTVYLYRVPWKILSSSNSSSRRLFSSSISSSVFSTMRFSMSSSFSSRSSGSVYSSPSISGITRFLPFFSFPFPCCFSRTFGTSVITVLLMVGIWSFVVMQKFLRTDFRYFFRSVRGLSRRSLMVLVLVEVTTLAGFATVIFTFICILPQWVCFCMISFNQNHLKCLAWSIFQPISKFNIHWADHNH